MLKPVYDSTYVGSTNLMLLHSLMMRTLLESLPPQYAKDKNVRYIHKRLIEGEYKMVRKSKLMYQTVLEISKAIMPTLLERYHQYAITTELAVIELYTRQEVNFKKHFKLKDSKLVQLYKNCDCELENETFILVDDMMKICREQIECLEL